MKGKFRTGNGVLGVATFATGHEADVLRATIRWNAIRERSARAKGRIRDADRYAENRASCNLALVAMALNEAA